MKSLFLFWACTIGILAGGALAVQVMGPPAVPAVTAPVAAHTGPQPPVLAQPARALPSRADPAPALKMTLASIPEPDPALLEPAPGLPGRMLPRLSGTGRTAAGLYAAAFDPAERHPRVALVIDGAGLDRALTAQANRVLPAGVDFAFSAYAPPADAARLASAARALGRECLVSIPMEPNGYPADDEGDRALLTGADPAQSRQNLDWALSGVEGCVGATGAADGMGGERFAASRADFTDMLHAVTARGLLYLDPRPDAKLPEALSAAPYVADVVLDRAAGAESPADAQTIDRNLAALEQIAARRGAAIGLAGPLTPVLLDRIVVWAHGLPARGLVLAPLSALPAARAPQGAPLP